MVRLCWSESGAPHTEPPREEAGQPRDTPEPMLDQVSLSPELWLLVMEELYPPGAATGPKIGFSQSPKDMRGVLTHLQHCAGTES